MLKSVILSVPLLVSGALAAPSWGPWGGNQNWGGYSNCLNDSTVQTLISGYTYLLEYPTGSNFVATANSILDDNVVISSDSINSLANRPLGVPAYPSKQAFIAGQAQTPALPGLETLGYFYNCNQIAWRWNVTEFGTRQYPVKGIITFTVSSADLITEVYSEFNSLAFSKDIPQQ